MRNPKISHTQNYPASTLPPFHPAKPARLFQQNPFFRQSPFTSPVTTNPQSHRETTMETSTPQSFIKDLRSREISGFRVRKRPFVDHDWESFRSVGAFAVEHEADPSPPMAMSFCKTNENAHIVAVADEAGYVTLLNTRHKFNDSYSYQENTERAKVIEWVAHQNAIFDLCWIKDDAQILSASGDQSIKIWDIQEKKCVRSLRGHTGSIKSICCHPTNHELIVSGSRDGSFAVWDSRSSNNANQKNTLSPISVVHDAHTSPGRRRGRRGKAESRSITSVLYLKDGVSIATAGAVDSVIKFWDTRNLKAPVNHSSPNTESNYKVKRSYGISCLSQDSNGVFITASCLDHRIYMYNVLQLEKGPIKTFTGGRTDSFFVKSAISPDAAHILSGSSDGSAYVWQVNRPFSDPISLTGHGGEVTSVAWSPSMTGEIATCSDDFTVRLWSNDRSYSYTKSPVTTRKRIMACPRMESRRNLFKTDSSCTESEAESMSSNTSSLANSVSSIKMPEISTPESQKRRLSFSINANDGTPEAENHSPLSVLSPPSSLKRKTIRDYFPVS